MSATMDLMSWVAGALAIGLTLYLFAVLLFPEDFS